MRSSRAAHGRRAVAAALVRKRHKQVLAKPSSEHSVPSCARVCKDLEALKSYFRNRESFVRKKTLSPLSLILLEKNVKRSLRGHVQVLRGWVQLRYSVSRARCEQFERVSRARCQEQRGPASRWIFSSSNCKSNVKAEDSLITGGQTLWYTMVDLVWNFTFSKRPSHVG